MGEGALIKCLANAPLGSRARPRTSLIPPFFAQTSRVERPPLAVTSSPSGCDLSRTPSVTYFLPAHGWLSREFAFFVHAGLVRLKGFLIFEFISRSCLRSDCLIQL